MLLAAEAAVPDQSNVEDMRYLNDPSIMPGKACARSLLHTTYTIYIYIYIIIYIYIYKLYCIYWAEYMYECAMDKYLVGQTLSI